MTAQFLIQEHLRAERQAAENRKPYMKLTAGSVKDNIRIAHSGKNAVAEFISTGDFAAAFFARQRYEYDAGRLEEPLLYEGIYDTQMDENFPETMTIYRTGPVGAAFGEVKEGGETNFASVGSSNITLTQKHYAIGLEYTEQMFIYNEFFRLANMERDFGQAYNALLNYLHLNPIIASGTVTYTGNNYTDGTAMTSFRTTDRLEEKYMRALELAIDTATDDTTNPRRGPYVIMTTTSAARVFRRALNPVPQTGLGFDQQGNAMDDIQQVIAYNGWTGVRGNETVTYAGATSGYAWLIDVGMRRRNFLSYWKMPLRRQMGNEDLSRFILDQVIWDAYLAVYTALLPATHLIKLPVVGSGT